MKQKTSFKYVDRCAWEEISIVLEKINVRADLQFRRLPRLYDTWLMNFFCSIYVGTCCIVFLDDDNILVSCC